MNHTRQIPPILFIASATLLAVMVFVTDGVEGRTTTVDDHGGANPVDYALSGLFVSFIVLFVTLAFTIK